jgi:hypothetical protein
MDQASIGDMLNDVPAPEAVTEEIAETVEAQPETVERPRGPDGKFISKETGVETPTAEPAAEPVPPTELTDRLPRDVYEPLKAIRNENQELKAQLAAIQARLEAPQAPPPQQVPTDFWDDPQSFMEQRLSGLGEQLLQQFEQRQTARRMDASEQAAKAKYTDYDEAFSAFEQAVQLNPRLAQELAMAPDPGEFAYARGKTAIEIQKVGSIDELRKQIRSELEAEARQAIQPVRAPLPSTTAADGSVGARGGPAWGGPAPLGSMLG